MIVPQSQTRRRGLTLVELMLALSITAMVAGAIAGMLGVVTTGVTSRQDNRTVMIRANAARTRISSYVAPCKSVLSLNDSRDLAIWLSDTRGGGAVHASEVRWLVFDPDEMAIDVFFVDLPDEWTQAARDIEDLELPTSSNWSKVRAHYQSRSMLASRRLMDGLVDVRVSLDHGQPIDSRHLTFALDIETADGFEPVIVTATIRHPDPPVDP